MVDGLAVQTLVGEMAEGRMMTLLVDWMAVKLGLDGEQRTYAYARAHIFQRVARAQGRAQPLTHCRSGDRPGADWR
jgi:hypothetical protein